MSVDPAVRLEQKRRANKRYYATEKGKAANRRWELSGVRKTNVDPEVRRLQKLEASKRYYRTDRGRERGRLYSRAYYEKNKDRMIQYQKDYYKREGMRERVRHTQFLRMYGITLDQYNSRLAEQGGLCAICRKPEKTLYRGQPRMLSVDHDHETGAVRGLLCAPCNIVLGAARDDVLTLRRAIEYLAPTMTGGIET